MIDVTDLAAEETIKRLIKRNTPNAFLRLGVKSGGCSGFEYVLEFADVQSPKDTLFNIKNINIIIDSKSMKYLNNLILDYENTLLQKGFKFINSDSKSNCGCGKSVSF